MNRARYRERAVPPKSDVRTSLGRFVGEATSDPGFVHRRARDAYHGQRGVWIDWDDYVGLPMEARLAIEVWARRKFGRAPMSNGGR